MAAKSEIRTPDPLVARTERHYLIALLLLAALLRLGVICWKPESLSEDRDLYWGIAKHLAAGHGFANPDWGHPTAYRPPLYPWLLAGILFVGGGAKLLAFVQIGLSVSTVWLTWRLAKRLGLRSMALLAAAFVAVNPLLVQTTALAMTETLSTFLQTLLLLILVETRPGEWRHRWGIGVLFGLAALCRPTIWAFAVLASVVSVAGLFVRRSSASSPRRVHVLAGWLAIALTCGLTVAPWVIRNYLIFGEPILTTTHGGYTLLLGNNDEVYRAEIAEPTGQPWDSRAWQQSLSQAVRQRDVGKWMSFQSEEAHLEFRELKRDRRMSDMARTWIRQHPREFAESCWLRVRRFWNIFPGGADAGSLPKLAQWGMALFFAIELLAAAIGLWRLRRDEWSRWWPLVLLVLSFALVHVVYWSNLRMRAPVEPVLALLAARGLVLRNTDDADFTDGRK
ncbi:MAG: glycosyltransferase family 39 protein [Planctomycetaceae bacterium]